MKRKWFLQTWLIGLLLFFGILGIPGVIGVILLIWQYIDDRKQRKTFQNLQSSHDELLANKELQEKEILSLQTELKDFLNLQSSYNELLASKELQEKELLFLRNKLEELGADSYFEAKAKMDDLSARYTQMEQQFNLDTQKNNETISRLRADIADLQSKKASLDKQTATQDRKLRRSKELYKSVEYCITNFIQTDAIEQLSDLDAFDYDEFSPSVILKLHCMDIKDLRKAYRENDKAVNHILEAYASRYTTKANKALYQLMVIALRAELQNILHDLKYEKLDQAVSNVKDVTAKYLHIAGAGNQSIAGTLTKFIGEIEYLFIDAVKIEYNYYVKKEQARQEQMAIKQQMREEAEERKAIELQRKKVEQEESKYQAEINKANEALSTTTDDAQIAALQAKILELQGQLSDVTIKKDEITKLQNGKAGNVYIISNLGSFGENVFKIGMTRRLNPQDRIDELGSASVPFRFDVHSFIFSDDAVGLESKLHSILNNKRVNKVNMRKEFFYSTLDELEKLVNELDPTAEFTKTMIAEEFRQSQSTDTPYVTDYVDEFDEEESEE